MELVLCFVFIWFLSISILEKNIKTLKVPRPERSEEPLFCTDFRKMCDETSNLASSMPGSI